MELHHVWWNLTNMPLTLWRWGSSCVKMFLSVPVCFCSAGCWSWAGLGSGRLRFVSSSGSWLNLLAAYLFTLRRVLRRIRRHSWGEDFHFTASHHINKLKIHSSPAAEPFNSKALRGRRVCLGSEVSRRDRVRTETQNSWNIWTVWLSWSAAETVLSAITGEAVKWC